MATRKETVTTNSFLTHYRKKVEVEGGGIFYLKALSTIQVQDREQYALICSAAERRHLKDPSSRSYQAYIAPIADLDTEDLDLRILAESIPLLRAEVMMELPSAAAVAPPVLGPNATLEEREAAAEGREEPDETRLERARSDALKARYEAKKATLAMMTTDAKIVEATRLAIASRCDLVYREALTRAMVILSTYRDEDCSSPVWDLSEDAPIHLMNHLYQEYQEVGSPSIHFLPTVY